MKKKHLLFISAKILALGLLVTCNTINNNPLEKDLSLQSIQADIIKPIIIKKFVDGSNEIKEILYYSRQNIHLKTKDDKMIVLQSHQIKGISSQITQKKIQTFLSKNAWIKIQKNTNNTYTLTAHVKNYGGMESLKNEFEDLNLNIISYKLSNEQKNELEALAEHYDYQIMVIEDNEEGKKIGIWGKNKNKITLAYNGEYFRNYEENTTTINFVEKKICDKKSSLFYCVYKEKNKNINNQNIRKLQENINKKIEENRKLLDQSKKKQSTLINYNFFFSKKSGKKPVLSSENRIKSKKQNQEIQEKIFIKKTRTDYPQVKKEEYKALDIYLEIINGLDEVSTCKTSTKKNEIFNKTYKKIQNNPTHFYPLVYTYTRIKEEYENHKEHTNFLAYINAYQNDLLNKAKTYFNGIYTETIQLFNFKDKEGGKQSGKIMTIKYQNEKEEKYYIKTHQNGTQEQSRSTKKSSQAVDPKEIFMYKVLEFIGIGPEVHFFGDPKIRGNCYIATKDAGGEKNEFFTYRELRDNKKINKNDEYVIKGLTIADILSRIFNITDVIDNKSNFGFVDQKIKIIDFLCPRRYNVSYKINDIFLGFLQGNGSYHYDLNDSIIEKTFSREKGRPKKKRIEMAKKIMDHELKELENAIKKSYAHIKKEIEKIKKLNEKAFHEQAESSLDNYYNDINKNLANFKTGLAKASNNTLSQE